MSSAYSFEYICLEGKSSPLMKVEGIPPELSLACVVGATAIGSKKEPVILGLRRQDGSGVNFQVV